MFSLGRRAFVLLRWYYLFLKMADGTQDAKGLRSLISSNCLNCEEYHLPGYDAV
jgi:hypothetical protein